MARELVQQGWRAAAPEAAPDLVIVNTCTVTKRADQQARQAIRRLAREHPGTPVWVTGCYAQRAPAEVAALPGVQAVFGNQEKVHLAHLLNESPPALARDAATGAPGLADPLALLARPVSPGPPGSTKARSPLARPESSSPPAHEARDGIDSPFPLTGEARGGADSLTSLKDAAGGGDSPSPLRAMGHGGDSPSPLRGEGWGGGEAGTR